MGIGVAGLAIVGARTLLATEPTSIAHSQWPCLAVWHLGLNRNKLNAGLKLAVWSDGSILFSPLLERLGEHLLIGAVEQADIKEMLKAIRVSGFYDIEEDYVVPDSSYTIIAVREDKEAAVRSFHEYLLPGFGGDMNTDAKYRRFVRMWKRTSGAIEALPPVRVERLGDRKEYRGYQVDRWYETEWRDAKKWTGIQGK